MISVVDIVLLRGLGGAVTSLFNVVWNESSARKLGSSITKNGYLVYVRFT